MSTRVIAEYPSEGFALLRDRSGSYIFTQEDSILPIDDIPQLTLRPRQSSWLLDCQRSREEREELDFMH